MLLFQCAFLVVMLHQTLCCNCKHKANLSFSEGACLLSYCVGCNELICVAVNAGNSFM